MTISLKKGTDTVATGTVALLGCLGVLALAILSPIITGYVLATLWGWFLTPLGVAGIGVAQAIGISVLIGLFTSNLKAEKHKGAEAITVPLLTPLLALLIGYIVHLFM